eukprot:755184-Hanusia_phi.AAC.3
MQEKPEQLVDHANIALQWTRRLKTTSTSLRSVDYEHPVHGVPSGTYRTEDGRIVDRSLAYAMAPSNQNDIGIRFLVTEKQAVPDTKIMFSQTTVPEKKVVMEPKTINIKVPKTVMEPYEYTVQEPRTIIDEQVVSVPKTIMEEQEVKIPVLRMVPRTVMVPMMTYVTKHVQENEKVQGIARLLHFPMHLHVTVASV